jgi:hypothetical protein
MAAQTRFSQRGDERLPGFACGRFRGLARRRRKQLLDPPRPQSARRAFAARLRRAEGKHMMNQLGDRRVFVDANDAAVPHGGANRAKFLER